MALIHAAGCSTVSDGALPPRQAQQPSRKAQSTLGWEMTWESLVHSDAEEAPAFH